jgi:hypothetical protein
MGAELTAARATLLPVPPILAVEGNSGVGKSVTSRAVAARLGTRWHPEHGEYLLTGRGEALPSSPPPNRAAVLDALPIWTVLEMRRLVDMVALPGVRAWEVVDCSLVSVVAFELAKRRAGQPNAPRELARQLVAALDAGLLTAPSAWLFLAASAGTVLDRIAHRGGSLPFLIDRHVIEWLDLLRLRFVEQFATPGRATWVDNDAIAVEEAAGCGVRLVETLHQPLPDEGLRGFLASVADDPDAWAA